MNPTSTRGESRRAERAIRKPAAQYVPQPAMNRAQRRTFETLFRRKKLRLLPPALFAAEARQFVFLHYAKNW